MRAVGKTLVRVGTRGSRLSMIQTVMVADRIKIANPDVEIEQKVIATSGDLDKATPIFRLSQKGVFEKEVDEAVLSGNVDFAVHSMKDVPTRLSSNLILASVPERGATADVLVSRSRKKLMEIPDGTTIGTSSLLRTAQLRRVRPGLRPEPIRGNVDTRVQKVEGGEYGAVILAEAGLARLGIIEKVTERLSLDEFLPAPGQGALAVTARRDDLKIIEILRTIEHSPTRAEVEAERALVEELEGGCKVPIGAIASSGGNTVRLTACVLSLDGQERLIAKREGAVQDAEAVGKKAGEDLLEKGAKKIEESWRTIYS